MNDNVRKAIKQAYGILMPVLKSKELNIWGKHDDEKFVLSLLNQIDNYIAAERQFYDQDTDHEMNNYDEPNWKLTARKEI
jgi:hypothetical protein